MTKTKDDILRDLQCILEELFEVPKDEVHETAHLYDDLDLDSIDAIDMVVRLQEMTGKKVKPEDFKNARVVQDIVDSVYELLNNEQ